ncbi:10380_t:CDS:2 [Acaulospora colombiana]|uniref:10380_t:CDS:1 n=1 Tax=Acaulospora colombiana TaxID=27376 RepID=A0ACA9NAK4_9GLOM|nr:10380_t:CDS:2 [Acaulospora colombiana]
MEISVLSQDRKWEQVEASDVFVTNKPELESVLILGQPWFQENAMNLDFPNKTLTLLNGTSCEYLPIQDLKNCCSLDNVWKTEAIREICKRLIVDCTFIDNETTVKALIDPKSQYNSISKTLAKKIDLYITRMYGSEYPAVEDLGIGATNAGKKVMVRGWLRDEKVSVSLPDIFELEKLAPHGQFSQKYLPRNLCETYEHFLVVDKPEYDLVLGSTWLTRLGGRIDGRDGRYWESNEDKRLYYARSNIDIVSPSLYTFYELLFPKFTTINSDGEVILTKFSEHRRDFDGLMDVSLPVIIGTIQDNNIDFISAFSNYLREIDGVNPNHSSWVTNNYVE